jgi:hypothetical protein
MLAHKNETTECHPEGMALHTTRGFEQGVALEFSEGGSLLLRGEDSADVKNEL